MDPAPDDAPVPPADPLDRLVEDRPALFAEIAERTDDPELRWVIAELIGQADTRLVDLLLPAVPLGVLPDRRGEDPRVDLLDAHVQRDGSVLSGEIRGIGVHENGAWLGVDVGGGPALDLLFGFGNAWSRESTLDGGGPSPALAREALPVVEGDTVRFEVDLSGSSRFEPGHSGAAVAMVRSFDGSVEDVGPGGILGEPPTEGVDVLLALVSAGPVADADLALALAVTFGTLRPLAAAEALPLVDADAIAWLRFGESLDAWLEEHGAPWSFSSLDALGKLVWAWPAAQSVAYGALPLARLSGSLDAESWRFTVPDAGTLTRLRDSAPMGPSQADTARAIDASAWARLSYRSNEDLMRALCAGDGLDRATCDAWKADRRAGRSLGTVGGQPIGLDGGASASFQLGLLDTTGGFVGDCATATTLAIAQMQAVGIPALGLGWAGDDNATPTHDVPLWYDGMSFRGTQRGPGPAWKSERAFVYLTLPGVHPVNAFALASEPNGWARGGAVAGGWTSYHEVDRILRDGLPASIVGQWIDVQAAGGWPTW